MVSYPDDSGIEMSSTLSAPFRSSRAPSVASTSARSSHTVRASRHRHQQQYSKSHAGVTNHSSNSSGHAPINEFPTFDRTGDVEIVIASGRKESRYVLHKLYLAQCSGWFEDVLDIGEGDDAPGPSSRSHIRAANRIRFELDSGKTEEPLPMLILKPSSATTPDDHGRGPPLRPKPRPPSNGFFRSMSNFSALHSTNHPPDPADEVLHTYDNLFRIFYNHEPLLDKTNIAVAYTQCKVLLQLAASYESLTVIGSRIDHHLLRFGTRLWKQIAKYPPSYLKLGYLARSRAIFSEALIHVVGQWPLAESALRGQVPPEVLDLVEDKVDEIEEQRQRVDSKLWRLTLTTSRGERVAPGVAWLDWLVMSLWRQWFAENTTPIPTSILKDSANGHSRSSSGVRDARSSRSSGMPTPQVNLNKVFHLLGLGGQAYLNHDEVKKFLKLSPEMYSRDNLRRAERRLEEVKNLARDTVQPLIRNFLELDTTRDGSVPYLTCVRVTEQELPW